MRIREPLLWVSGLFVALVLAAAPVSAKEAAPAKSAKPAPPPASAKQSAESDEAPPKNEKPAASPTCKKTSDCPEGMTCTKSGKVSRCTAGPRPIPHVVT
jgi:hypothetical protein